MELQRSRDNAWSARFRKLLRLARLLWTSVFAVLCVGCVLLWVRSYSYADGGMFSTLPGQHVAFHGGLGRMCVWFEHSAATRWFDWHARPITATAPASAEDRIPVFHLKTFWPTMTRLYVAHWFLAVVAGTLAVAPWCPRRLTLRGLMITVTALAVIMALVAWIDRPA